MLRPAGLPFRSVLTLVLSSLLIGASYATTWTVCSSGCDFSSIQEAVDSAVSGDTVQLEAGTFFENVCVTGGFGREPFHLTIRGAGASSTVVNGSGADLPVFAANAQNDDSECVGRRSVVLSLSDMTIENSAVCGVKAKGSGDCWDQCRPPISIDVSIDNCVIRNNRSGVNAGGLGGLHINRTTITGNDDYGIQQFGRTRVSNTTISDNGWGLRVLSRVDMSNSTVSGNAGGVLTWGSARVYAKQSTIADNLGPGVMFQGYPGSHPQFDATGTIMANNLGGNCWLTSQGNNLSSDSCSVAHPTDITVSDPLLLPLTDNGGPTATHALDPGSPAIDACGDACEPTDQRGVPRPQDGDGDGEAICDIGAFELAPLQVQIDIKPGGFPNSINPRSRGVIPVALLGSAKLDVATVDVDSVRFGPDEAGPRHNGHLEDVNYDAIMDLVVHFRTQETGITCGDEWSTVTGESLSGEPFEGIDSIRTVGCSPSSGRRPSMREWDRLLEMSGRVTDAKFED